MLRNNPFYLNSLFLHQQVKKYGDFFLVILMFKKV